MTKFQSRKQNFETVKNNIFDLIIIGGGIVGAGTARDAALRGLKVALFEKNDFSAGTSSQSTKLIHGGLRYLKNYDFFLVREAALERKKLIEIAPHLCDIRDFIVPNYKWSQDHFLLLRLGLIGYDVLSFPKNLGLHKWYNKNKIEKIEPLIENDELRGAGIIKDVMTNDSRLVIANLQNAATEGASIINYCRVENINKKEEYYDVKIIDLENGDKYSVKTKMVINATGPWSDIVSKKFDTKHNNKLRLTWGAHLVLNKKSGTHPVLIVNKDGRAVFLIPHEKFDIIGTTDIDYKGDPDLIAPTEFDKDYILSSINSILPNNKYSNEDILSAFSGLRPLVLKKTDTSEGKVSRKHLIRVEENGVITAIGGKLTTYRLMAKEIVDKSIKILKLKKSEHKCLTGDYPVFGGDFEYKNKNIYFQNEKNRLEKDFGIDEETSSFIVKQLGSEVKILDPILIQHGVEKISNNNYLLTAMIIYYIQYEFARTPIDILRRRTWIMLEKGNGLNILDQVIDIMTSELNWDDKTKNMMKKRTIDYINNFMKIT